MGALCKKSEENAAHKSLSDIFEWSMLEALLWIGINRQAWSEM